MSNTEVRKVFFYDKEEDSDIQEWIDNLPSRSHSEFIRKAIRTMIEIEKNNQPSESVNDLEKRIALLEQEMNEVKTYIINNSNVHFSQTLDEGNSHDNREENKRRNFVDASHIIKNLGK